MPKRINVSCFVLGSLALLLGAMFATRKKLRSGFKLIEILCYWGARGEKSGLVSRFWRTVVV